MSLPFMQQFWDFPPSGKADLLSVQCVWLPQDPDPQVTQIPEVHFMSAILYLINCKFVREFAPVKSYIN